MIPEQAVRDALHSVKDPEIGKPIDDIGMLDSVQIEGDTVRVHVLLTVAACPLKDEIQRRVTEAVRTVPGVGAVDVTLGAMDPDKRAELVASLQGDMPFRRPDSRTTVIGV